MSKQGKRKITVELSKSKDLSNRPSVFERLGTKKASAAKKTTEYCRQWAQHGTCAYGKSCKFASTHTLISPSKQRAANKDIDTKRIIKDDGKNRLHSTVVVRSGRSPDGEIDNWDQNDLEYADTDVLEKRRQQLQRELEIQLKMDSGKDHRKGKKKQVSSSSSSRSSSTSSLSSSTSGASSSSSSSGRDTRKKIKKGKPKRNSSSSSEPDVSLKKKHLKSDSIKRDKPSAGKNKSLLKKDDTRLLKKHDVLNKKKVLGKPNIIKKSLSPGKKAGGTPPISIKSVPKGYALTKHTKSPLRREKNRSVSPHSTKEREKERLKEREREKEREKEREREREKERNRLRSRSPRQKLRSRSPTRRHGSHPKDPRRKESSERSRPISPKKPARRDLSTDKHRKTSPAKDDRRSDRSRDHKDRSLERHKDKHDDKDRHERERKERERLNDVLARQRERDRLKDRGKRDSQSKRSRGRDGGGLNRGLEKPSKPMERLLPRPEERMAALAAITNRTLDTDKTPQTSKDRQDSISDRGARKQDRMERERSERGNKRGSERMDSLERDRNEYERGLDRPYDHGHSMERPYDRGDRYEDVPRDGDNRSPAAYVPGRERHYDSPYGMAGHPRGYNDPDEVGYNDRIPDHRAVELGFDERGRRDHSWDGREPGLECERPYHAPHGHPHKEWEGDEFHGEWARERHWQHMDPQMQEWADKEPDIDGQWHPHRPPGAPPVPMRAPRIIDEGYGRPMRLDHVRGDAMLSPHTAMKRRPARPEPDPAPPGKKPCTDVSTGPPSSVTHDGEDNAIPDDLSEISDDPDDILNRDDMMEPNPEDDGEPARGDLDELSHKHSEAEHPGTKDPANTSHEIKAEPTDGTEVEEALDSLDFEEISDGELEEDQRVKGLGDALGVDWASLVAEVRKGKEGSGTALGTGRRGARDAWRPRAVLARVGLSLHMAGEELVRQVMEQEDGDGDSKKGASKAGESVKSLHPVASIQVAIEKRKRQRVSLFTASGGLARALSARRDLALRRLLCSLPAGERAGHQPAHHPSLFHAARTLLLQGSG